MGDHNKHFPFSASASKRWINCPGSWQLERVAPVSPSGEAARIGTAVHAIIEDRLRTMSPAPADALAGLSVLLDTSGDFKKFLAPNETDSNGYIVPITDAMIQNAQLCLTLVEKIMDQRPDAEVFSEMKTVLIPDEVGGTADIVILDGDWGCVIDYKNGVVHVDVEDNNQLMVYTLGILENCKLAERVEKWTLAIVQPNDIKDPKPVRTWRTSTGDLSEFAGLPGRAVSDCKEVPLGSQNPKDYCSGDWCQWCKGSSNCPLQKRAMLTVANKELPDIPDFGEEPIQSVPVGQLTNDQIGWVLTHAAMIKKHMDNVQAEALDRMQKGVSVPGFKLVESRSNRKVTDTKGLESAAEKEGWDVWQTKLGPLPQLDKQVPKTELAKYITKPKGKITWAPEMDKRPAVANLLDGLEEI